ncbi:hypothetical protein MPSEU_000905900 [Mayamaea pseudoterrestris]|nr:hypothetical protein MPSEU_000905900 [Mayamaea pseudoterrestris]
MTVNDNPNVGIAFALTCGAGAATGLGAAVVFVPSLVKLASKRVLAGGLGLSAGVMTYVSFVEIFRKSNLAFQAAGHEEGTAYALATGCFFGGVVFMILLNAIVTWLLKGLGGHHHSHDIPVETNGKNNNAFQQRTDATEDQDGDAPPTNQPDAAEMVACACCSNDPVGDLDRMQQMAEQMDRFVHKVHHDWDPAAAHEREQEQEVACCEQGTCSADCSVPSKNATVAPQSANLPPTDTADKGAGDGGAVVDDERIKAVESAPQHVHDEALVKMSINTALAIALHNFPEGLATFVAALDNPKVGVVLAVAIAIHNIPEGLCVALPIYYATGNKWKAFTWACLSGISEPFAALLGWAVLANSFTDTMYATLFGLVGGMMVIISARELLPTAHRYDPEDSVVTYSFMAGMFIMALSLTLFLL